MINIIVIFVLAAIIGMAAGYVYKARKRGQKCIGCPEETCSCQSGCNGCGGSCDGR